jgi:hypothetical protein
MVKVAAMMDCASVNVCREVKRRNETSTQGRYGSNEWAQDPEARTRVAHQERLRRHPTPQIRSTGAADLEVSSANSCVPCVGNECNFWPKLEAWPKVSSRFQVFLERFSLP